MQEKQSLAAQRSKDRLRAVKNQGVMRGHVKQPSQTHTERLLRMRLSTQKTTLYSLNNAKPIPYRFEKTGPMSNLPNFQSLRHMYQKARMIFEQGQQLYNHPQLSPVKQISENTFISPGKTVYNYGHTVIEIQTPGGHHTALHPLEEQQEKPRIKRVLFDEADQISSVALSYRNLKRPSGHAQPIDNKKSQGGFSADELFDQQFKAFKEYIVSQGFASAQEMEEYTENIGTFHHEHTHLIASHFGILKNDEGQVINPRDKNSTFVALNHLNTEMMLFEKFADFLVYINYHRHSFAYDQKCVDYTCKILFAENTKIAIGVQLVIEDKNTGIIFTQTWDSPYRVINKPSIELYSAMLQALKLSLDRNLQGPRI